MVSVSELRKMSKLSFSDIDKNHITEINSIVIDTSLTPQQRIESYLNSVENPYFLRIDDTIIKMSFSDNNNTIQELFSGVLLRKKAQKM